MIKFQSNGLPWMRPGLIWIVVSAFGLSALHAQAQDTSGTILEEIIVTAAKRGDQDLQSVPVTITAFSSESLQQRALHTIEDISLYTAGMDLQKEAPGRSTVIIRGVALGFVSSAEPQNRSTTGIYLNDVAFDQNGQNPDPDLFDLERVEVLKGPQGSLFGSSAMAGAVRYVTKRPVVNEYSGRLVGDYSNTSNGGNSSAFRGVVNIPLADDTFAARLMAYQVDNGGWVDNIITGNSDINTDKSTGARVSLFWQPAETFAADLMIQFQNMAVGHGPNVTEGASRFYDSGPSDPDALQTISFLEESWDDEILLSTLELNWDLDWGTLTSVTGYVDREFERDNPTRMFEAASRLGFDLPNPFFNDPWFSKKFSQELRTSASVSETVSLTAGVYYSDGEVQYGTYAGGDGWDELVTNDFRFGNPPAAALGCAPELSDHAFCGYQNNTEEQIAFFGELDFFLSERTTLTAGGRWYDYDQHFFEPYGGFFNGGPTVGDKRFSEDGFNPKLAISFQASDDLLWFASAAKGFRMGGVDDPLPIFCNAELESKGLTDYTGIFHSDSLWTYEAGAKSTLNAGRMTLNGSVFRTQWEDIQTGEFLGSCGYRITQNASEQAVTGIEFATTYALTDSLQIQFNGNYTNSELSADAPAVSGSRGDRAPYVPEFTFNGILDYQQDLAGNLQGFVLLAASYKSDSYTTYDREFLLPSQFIGNIRLGVRTDRYTATLYANNFTDEDIVNNISFNPRGGETNWRIGRPRTFGVQLMLDF